MPDILQREYKFRQTICNTTTQQQQQIFMQMMHRMMCRQL